MDTQSTLKTGELERLTTEDSFLRELAIFFAHRQMKNLLEIPRVISVYSSRDNYEPILRKFLDYLNAELSEEFRNGDSSVRPRVIVSKQDEPNTYSIPVDFFLERRKMPAPLPPIPVNGRADYIYSPQSK